ncbi:MAG TPA: orotidine-5'-phosphate decarboxylase [Trueperaceae bacterium]|nr:orotidine-5'-phosphate decarboxylase [Trueperaceae bacterium]
MTEIAADPTPQASPVSFTARLHDRRYRLGTAVCLGLDPRPAAHPLTRPERLGATHVWEDAVLDAVAAYCVAVLDATHDLIAACKPQAAFFEALGPGGMDVLAQVTARARALGVPVILDAKRGDIGTTAEAYAQAYLGDGPLAVDAVTVNPYLGLDTITPFLEAAVRGGRAAYVLVRTSNPGSRDLQRSTLSGGGTLATRLAADLDEIASGLPADDAGYTPLGAVAGDPSDLAEMRAALPRSPLLVPGYGAQGARAVDVTDAFDRAGLGAVVNASRSLTYGPGSEAASTFEEVGEFARAATLRMRDELEGALAISLRGSPGKK